jgi:hypothetical protein
MSRSPTSFPATQRLLAPGQSIFEKMPRGTVIRVAAGSVVLVQRTMLDYDVSALQCTLRRGAVHRVQVSDWLEIVAQADTELVLMVPSSPSLRAMWDTVGALLQQGRHALVRSLARAVAQPQQLQQRCLG